MRILGYVVSASLSLTRIYNEFHGLLIMINLAFKVIELAGDVEVVVSRFTRQGKSGSLLSYLQCLPNEILSLFTSECCGHT